MQFLNEILSYFRSGKKNNWTVIVLCLFAGTIFWFFNALNKTYTTNIRYPISFDFDADRFQATRSLPSALNVNLTGVGWDLLRKSLGVKVPPLVIHIDNPGETRKIVGSSLPAIITDQLNDVQLNYVLTDTLFIFLDYKVSKKFFLHVDSLNVSLDENFAIVTPITLSRDSVLLTGPESLITSLPDTILLSLGTNEIDEAYEEEVAVMIPRQELITRDPPTVSVTFNVAEFVPEVQNVTVSVVNIPENIGVSLIDSLVEVHYRKPENITAMIPADSFMVEVDYNQLNLLDTTLSPVLVHFPKGLLEVTMDTSRIKVILDE